MPKPKGFKRLEYHQILRVFSTDRYNRASEILQQVHPSILDDAPTLRSGFYVPLEHGVVLPKRRRGEKFRVLYTTVKEQVF